MKSIQFEPFEVSITTKSKVEELQAQRDALLAAVKNTLATLKAYQRVLAAAGNKPFEIPAFVIEHVEQTIANCEKA